MRGHDKNHIVIDVGHGDRCFVLKDLVCNLLFNLRRAVGDGVDEPSKIRIYNLFGTSVLR